MTPVTHERGSIPVGAWVAAAIIIGLSAFGILIFMMRSHSHPLEALFFSIPAVFLAGYALLVGFVYSDAKLRGMRYVMWTWLAILVPNGIGIILYFLLRDPVPVYCSQCGAPAQRGFGFCPRCGVGMAPACQRCHKICQPGWSHCPYCGATI